MAGEIIAAAGAGRMGRGIAITFAIAGHKVLLVDLKNRTEAGFKDLRDSAQAEIRSTLTMLSEIGLFEDDQVLRIMDRVEIHGTSTAESAIGSADVIFEGVPETLEAKKEAFGEIGRHANPEAIIASTTSTILSNDLAPMVSKPERFLNAHWLNPAFLVPLVELSPADETSSDTTDKLKALLESIGKIPVVCAASPGFIVPRIQALAMNEAARMVEEGVASVDDIDKATKYGFGFRFAILGMLEFVDWGGGDILYHASKYMHRATGSDRFKSPDIVGQEYGRGQDWAFGRQRVSGLRLDGCRSVSSRAPRTIRCHVEPPQGRPENRVICAHGSNQAAC